MLGEIKELRTAKKINQVEMSANLGVSKFCCIAKSTRIIAVQLTDIIATHHK